MELAIMYESKLNKILELITIWKLDFAARLSRTKGFGGNPDARACLKVLTGDVRMFDGKSAYPVACLCHMSM